MNVFDLSAKLTLDTSEYERNLSTAGERTQGFGDKLKSGLGTAAKIGAAAVTAAAGAIVAITKNAVQNYAEYEQLVGGVETLFRDSADVVQQYAANAYKTAGLSANEYMETVTSFSASLLQSLGGDTEQAARMADLAITDMSDNANKMGTDMASIQNAYQGFAKQNYTMLDNLKLGYGGTKEEMQRLIDDANKLREAQGLNADLTIDSYADVVAAIHEVQTEMGITGTTAKEASSTIQGSIAATKSAWQNLLTGLADPSADIGGLFDNLVESAGTAFDNLLPVIGQAIGSVGKMIADGVPKLASRLPGIIKTLVPTLIQAAISLVAQLVASLPQIVAGLFESIPVILDSIFQGFAPIVEGLGDLFGQAWQAVKDVFAPIGEWFAQRKEDVQNAFASVGAWFSDKFTAAKDAVHAVWEGIGNWFGDRWTDIQEKTEEIFGAIKAFFENTFGAIKDFVVNTVENIKTGVVEKWENIKSGVEEKVGAIKTFTEEKWNAIKDGITSTLETLKSNTQQRLGEIKNAYQAHGGGVQGIVAAGWTVIRGAYESGFNILNRLTGGKLGEIRDAFSNAFNNLKDRALTWGRDLLQNFINGITEKIAALREKVSNIAQTVKNFLGFSEPKEGPLSDFHTYAPDMMALFAKGIRDNEGLIKDQIEKSFDFGTQTIGFAPDIQGGGMTAGGLVGYGGITINVYAAQGQSEEEIARKVERRIAQNILSREAVWA